MSSRILEGKKLVYEIAESIKDKTKCIAVYGSAAKSPTEEMQSHCKVDSDIDFLVIYKHGVDPFSISKKIEMLFEQLGVPYDYAWFMEDYFLELLNKGIDLTLWWLIFKKGEVLYADEDFLEEVSRTLETYSPADSFLETYRNRLAKGAKLLQAFVRNLHRIALDSVWVLYYKRNNLNGWDNLPGYTDILCKAFSEGIITKNIMVLCENLHKLRKEMEKHPFAISLKEIDALSRMTQVLALGVLNGELAEQIDQKLKLLAKPYACKSCLKISRMLSK